MATTLDAATCVTLSMVHITHNDQDQLRTLVHPETDLDDTDRPHWWFSVSMDSFYAYPVRGGWLIEINQRYKKDRNGTMDLFSRAFRNLIEWARTSGFHWIRLDRAAEPNPFVPRG